MKTLADVPALRSSRSDPAPLLSLALLTTAHNEEEHLARTIESVVAQTDLPKCWIIVDDGSTDRTADIVERFAQQYPWIVLRRTGSAHARNFASKGRAINHGYSLLKDAAFDVVGIVDGDVSFEKDYFEFLLQRFADDPTLGVTGTAYIEGRREPPDFNLAESGHVPGQCQLFRRRCFEDIGGYLPMPEGGEDTIAVTTARMLGWKTRAWPEKTFEHHRPMGTSDRGRLRAAFQMGRRDYVLGGHPVWEFARAAFQTRNPPYLLGGGLLLAGYLWAALKREPVPVSKYFIAYRRKEQLSRLRRVFGKASRE